MKITGVELIPLVRRLEQAFEGGTYRIANRNTIVTRVYTDDGFVGEAFGGDEDRTQSEVVALARHHLAPMLVGEDPLNVERLWQRMFFEGGKVDLGNRGLHVLDLHNRAILTQAVAAIDNALWDLLGKIHGLPVYKLLGGFRDRIPVIAIGGYYAAGDSRDAIGEEIGYYRELGLAGMKFKVGRMALADDVRRVQTAREAAGDDFIIVCDANQAWTPQEAITFCREVEPLDIGWMEEPVRWYDQYEGLRMVRDKTAIPVNAGQGEITAFGCRDLINNGCVDILNVDATIAGGVTEWKRIAHMAGLFHVQMAHHEEPQVSLHLLAAVPNSLYVEIFPSYERDPMWVDLPLQQPRIRDGYMELPDRPGLGITLNEEVIARYRAD